MHTPDPAPTSTVFVTPEPTQAPKVYNTDGLVLEAQNVLLVRLADGNRGEQAIYAVNSDELIYPASTLKMITALTALDIVNPDETVQVGLEVYIPPLDCSRAGLEPGMTLTVHDLLEGLLLPSGADAAYVLGVYCGRQLEENDDLSFTDAIHAFVAAMNRKAEDIHRQQLREKGSGAMSLFAIGDLHLHFQSELKAPGQLHEPVWKNHDVKFKQNCEKLVKPDDTLVLVGDHSWGKKLPECEKDLEYICSLPGRKILLRGNHDMFWDAKKTEALNKQYAGKLFFLQNNYASYEDYAIVGTKGYTFEGPFYMRGNKIAGWDGVAESIAVKRIEREMERLRLSFEAALKDGYSRFIMFLHYPPTNVMERNSEFTAMAEKYKAEQVIYAHCHGEHRFHDSLEGRHHGIMYRLVSGDYLRWVPQQIL